MIKSLIVNQRGIAVTVLALLLLAAAPWCVASEPEVAAGAVGLTAVRLVDPGVRIVAEDGELMQAALGAGVLGPGQANNGPLFAEPVFATPEFPNFVSIGDLDGDGRPDLAVTTRYGNTVSVLLNRGNGEFATSVDYSVGIFPQAVAIRDVDNDGSPDLAVVNLGSGDVSVLRNSGGGTFDVRDDYVIGGSPSSIVIGDLDGDGLADLAVSNVGSDSVSVLRNLGDGTFDTPLEHHVGEITHSLAVGDVDGDGRADLVVSGSLNVSVLRNVSELGSVAFAAEAIFPTNGYPSNLAMSDLDGDGRLDIVSGKVSVRRNISEGGKVAFDVSVHFGVASGDSPYQGPGLLAIGDADGDDRPDIAVSGNTGVSVLKNISFPGDIALTADADYERSIQPIGVAIGDLDDDGRADLAVANGPVHTVSMLRNLGKGRFTQPVHLDGYFNSRFVAISDVDGDGRPDLAGVSSPSGPNGTVLLRRRLCNSVFRTFNGYSSGPDPASIAIGDLNGDGVVEFAVANSNDSASGNSASVWRGLGGGSFAARVNFTMGKAPVSIAIGDLDGDGLPELAVANSFNGVGGNSVSVRRNTSSGASAVTFAARVDFPTGLSPSCVAIGDLDGDGRPDLCFTNSGSGSLSVLRNTSSGAGTISFAARGDYSTGGTPSFVAIGDVDGDGRRDLIVTNRNGNNVSVLRNTSSGAGNIAFAARVSYATGRSPESVAIGDLDGDGLLDLAVANSSNDSVSILRNLGSGTFAPRRDYAAGSSPQSVAIGELTSDGRPDLAVANFYGNRVSILKNQLTPTIATSCPGDADGNCSVTFIDVTTVLANFGNIYGVPPATGPGDADRSGVVSFIDITSVLANFGSACGL